ncbi:hypothetical protein ACET3Z_025946 [Daucus carota]
MGWAISAKKNVILLALLLLVTLEYCHGDDDLVYEPDCLNVPTAEFLSSVKTTIDVVQQVTSIVAGFNRGFHDFRTSHAISDCLDLLDLSTDELVSTLSLIQHPHNSKNRSTGNLRADLKTWLSAALGNQDTCVEGFDGTKGSVKKSVASSLEQITSLVHVILSNVESPDHNNVRDDGRRREHRGHRGSGRPGWMHKRKLIGGEKFPEWVRSSDRKKLLQVNGVEADLVVDVNGNGNFTTLSDAIKAVPDYSTNRTVIYVKKGVYNEYVEISKKKWYVMLVGDGMDVTVISGNHSFIGGWTTYRSATFGVKGRGFIARDMTFQNTAGPESHQAVAFRSDSDLSVLYRCAMRGYQDTLYAHSQRQFFRECHITGTVDFIFGDAAAVFQNCQILARKGLPNQKNTITAQGRKEAAETTGFSIQFSNISVEPNVVAGNSTLTYLGRPWKLYSRTVIMQSYISNAIRPEGWLEWNTTFALDTLYYGEYMNYGPGAGLGSRVKWPGYRILNTTAEANAFTVAQFLLGNSWLPSTGVKYTAGLVV